MKLLQSIADQVGATMPGDVMRHFTAALSDLYNGPHGADHWRTEDDDPSAPDYSFVSSCDYIARWWNDVAEVPEYCDEDGGPLDAMDRANLEDEGILYYEVDRASVKRAIFGELASYL